MKEFTKNVKTLFQIIEDFKTEGVEIATIYKEDNTLFLKDNNQMIRSKYLIGHKYRLESDENTSLDETILKKWSVYENKDSKENWLFISKYTPADEALKLMFG